MQLLFSLYKEDYDTSAATLVYSKWICVESGIRSIEAVENHFQYNSGYRYEAFLGHNLSFCDFYCFFQDAKELIPIIESLNNEAVANCRAKKTRFPRYIRILEDEPATTVLSENDNLDGIFLYYRSRYECGAQGTNDIIYWMSTHPVEMAFIGGFLWDRAKDVFTIIKNVLFRKAPVKVTQKNCKLPTKKIYRNFESVTKIKAKDCQIIRIKQNNKGKIRLVIRTINNELFKVCSFSDCTIESIAPFTIEEFYSEAQ